MIFERQTTSPLQRGEFNDMIFCFRTWIPLERREQLLLQWVYNCFFSLFPFITITPNPVFTSNTALVLIHLCNHQKRLFLQKWMQSSMVFLENCTLVDDNKIVHYTFYPITHLKTKWKKKPINVLLVFFHLIAIASVLRYIVWPSVCSVTQA